MAKKINLQCEKRKILGRKVKTLRREGILPANIYGKDRKSLAVQMQLGDFEKVYKKAGETQIVDLKVAGVKKSSPVLIHKPQVNPVTDDFLHVDFHQVSLKEKVMAVIPVELKGRAPAAESGEGVLITILSELEVEALPTDLPEKLEADIKGLKKIDDSVRVKDIKIDAKKVKILAEGNEMVVKIEKPTKEEEPSVAEAEEGKEKPAEEAVVAEEGGVREEGGKPEEKKEKLAEEKKGEEKPATTKDAKESAKSAEKKEAFKKEKKPRK